MDTFKHGDMVRCLNESIDKQTGKGATGYILGFARFSEYHSLEAYVYFKETPEKNDWFWVRDLKCVNVK